MGDQRALPTKAVASIAKDIYIASRGDDDEALDIACHRWLSEKGYRKSTSIARFSFHSVRDLQDVEVHVTARIKVGKIDTEALRVSGTALLTIDSSDSELARVSAHLLIGVEAAIESATMAVVNGALYPKSPDTGSTYKLRQAARKLASTS